MAMKSPVTFQNWGERKNLVHDTRPVRQMNPSIIKAFTFRVTCQSTPEAVMPVVKTLAVYGRAEVDTQLAYFADKMEPLLPLPNSTPI
jgi:hypothetical protein